jgi:septation ring formation regulator EzrA
MLLLVSLGKDDYTNKIKAYAAVDGIFEKVQRGIAEIQAGHSQLAQHVDQLSNTELRAIIEQVAKDLQSISSNLNSLKS